MDPIKNPGMVDYAMTVPQQTQIQPQSYDDYSTIPMVYDPVMEEKKASASNGSGLKALAALGIAGIALYGMFRWGQSKGKVVEKEVEKIITEAGENVTKKIEQLTAEKEAYKTANEAYKAANDALNKGLEAHKTARENVLAIANENTSILSEGKAGVRKKVKNALKTEEIKTAEENINKAKEEIAKAEEEITKLENIADDLADDAAEAV